LSVGVLTAFHVLILFINVIQEWLDSGKYALIGAAAQLGNVELCLKLLENVLLN